MRPVRAKALQLLATVVALVLLGACTSVERAGTVDLASGEVEGSSSIGGGPGAGARPGVAASGTPGAAGTKSGGAAASGGPGGGQAGPTGSGDGAAPVTGEGGGPDFSGCPLGGPLRLGVSYSSDLAAGLAAVGQPDAAATAGSYTEQLEAIYGAIVDARNARGGVAGCQIELAYFDFSSLASDGFDGQSQKECAYFAEDAKVFAAYSAALETETVVECLAKRGVVSLFNGAEYAPIQRDFNRYRGLLYQPWQINTDRWGQFIDIWDKVGFFGKGAKVGILVADDGTGNGQKLAYDIWRPKLAALGIEVSVFEYKWIRSYASVSDASTALSAAVLKFKSEGVTHVLPTPDGAAMSIFFTGIADGQDYRPAYGTTTFSGGTPVFANDSQSSNWVTIAFDRTTLRHSATEVSPAEAQYPDNDARARCDEAVATVQEGAHLFYRFCDAIDFLEGSLRDSSEVSTAAMLAGAEGLGSGLLTASGVGPPLWGPGRYDAVAHVSAGKWNVGAGAFDLVLRPIPVR